MPKVIMVMMLSFMMILSGIAPSFYAFAEDAAEDAAFSTEEAAAPAAEEDSAEEVSSPEPAAAEPEPAPEPEPEPEPESASPSDTQTVNNEEAPSPSDVDADPAVTSADKAADTEKDADTEDADKDRKDEEEKYPAQDFSGSTSELDISVSAGKGVFPDGTQMKVRGASAEEVKEAAQKMAGEGTEVVDAAAADITFWNEGKEIQPKRSVSVKLSAKRALAGDSHEAVTVSDGGSVSVMSDASASSASFRTDHFTVYGITGTEYADDISRNVRYTYVFYDEEKPVSTQIVKQGEKVILPEVEDSEKFRWVDKATGDEVTNDTMVPEDATEDKTIDVVKAFDCWHGIFYTSSDAGTVCMTRAADKGVVELITKEEFENMGLVPEGQSFIGWREKDKTDTDIIAGAAVEVNGADIHLVPVFRDDLKVTLDANGGEFKTADENGEAAGSEALTLSVRYGDKIDFSDVPVRAGYSFTGWYRDEAADDDSQKWLENDVLENELVLYAGWKEAENSFILSVMRENAQNDNYSEKEHSEWASNNGTALKTGDPIPVSAILAQYGKDKYKSDHYHLNGTGAKQDDPRFMDSCPAVEVYHGGTKAAAFDYSGSCVEGDSAKAVIADKDTVVKVYYSLDSYQLYFRFDPELSANNDPVNGHDGGTQLSKYENRTAYDDYRTLMGTDWITGQSDQVLKYGEWMYAKAYGNNPRIRKLLDEGTHWWLDAVYRGSSGQQVVFNASNMYNPFRPADGTPDGQGVLILVKYNSRQKEHQIKDIYYDAAGKVVNEKRPITINYKTPRKHEFRIGSVVDGYELKEVTGPYDSNTNKYLELEAEPPQANGQTKFTYLYRNGEPLPMICHWYPAEYTITYVQVKAGAVDIADDCKEADQQHKVLFGESTDAAAEAQPSGGKWNVIKDKNGIRYDFDGIEVYTESGKKLDIDKIPEKMPSNNLVVYYRWTPEKFRVDYDPDNGEPVLTDSDIPANGRTKGYENLPGAEELKNEELEFRGWYECDDEGKPVSRFDFSTRIMKNYRLKAVWEPTDIYKVRYDANGGTLPEGLVDGMDPKAYRRDSDAKTVGSAKPGEGKNSRFIGWAVGTEKDKLITGSTFRVSDVNDSADGKSDNVITLVAKYETYKQNTTVVYHTNYPAGEENRTFETEPLEVNQWFRVLAIKDTGWSDTYAFDGRTYKFVCWTSAGGERLYVRSAGRDYFFPDELAAAGRWENDLYAVWEELPEVKNGIVAPTDTADSDVLGDYEDDGTDDNEAGSADIVRTAETSQPAASSGVKTGDETRLIAYIGIMIAAIILSLIIMAARRRRDLQ